VYGHAEAYSEVLVGAGGKPAVSDPLAFLVAASLGCETPGSVDRDAGAPAQQVLSCNAPPGEGASNEAGNPTEAGGGCGGGGLGMAPQGRRCEVRWHSSTQHAQWDGAVPIRLFQVGCDDTGDGGQVVLEAGQDVGGMHSGCPAALGTAEPDDSDGKGTSQMQNKPPTVTMQVPAAFTAARDAVNGATGQQQARFCADLLEALGDADYDGDKPSWSLWCVLAIPTLPQRPNLTSDLAHKNPAPRLYAAAPDS
jgi:hypothetical protein